MEPPVRADYCAVAIAETFRGDGEILASAIGPMPSIGARLAKLTFEPGLLMTDGTASLLGNVPALGAAKDDNVVESWMPFRYIFDLVWSGKRHVMMGATQIDRFGNTNIACIGDDWQRPKVQLLGPRGAPGNTIHHPTSYFIPKQGPRGFVERVDVVSGIGYDRARELGPTASRFHEIRRVVTNLGVFDFESESRSMRVRSVHPGSTIDEIRAATGFELVVPADVPETRAPTSEELRLLREVIDPTGVREKVVPE